MAKGKKTGGRTKGTPNKVGASLKAGLKALASEYTPECIALYVAILRNTEESNPTRMAAADRLMDRAHGKPLQALTGADDTPLIPPKTVVELHLPGVTSNAGATTS